VNGNYSGQIWQLITRNLIRVGARFDAKCTEIVSLSGHVLCWSSEMRYLGVNIVASRQFRVSIRDARRSFYRAANGIFGRTGLKHVL